MKAKLIVTEAGLVLASDDGGVLYSVKYRGGWYQKYKALLSGGKVEELEEVFRRAGDMKISTLEVNIPGLDSFAESHGIRAKLVGEQLSADERVRAMLEAGLVNSEEEALELMREAAVRVGEERIKEEAARLDLHAIQIVSAIDDLDRIVNLMAARVREWYGLHFPELDGILQDPHEYIRLVSRLGRRENFTVENLERLGVKRTKAEAIEKAARESKGAEIRDEELSLLQALATQSYNNYQLRLRLTSALDELMNRIAPNVTNLVGATIAARLLARAGGLDQLARLPASTIQVLGAEKALFRALRRGTKPPKHGVIFQHPLVHGSPRWQRGKIARALAAKLAIASRIDYYSGILDPSIKEKLEERIKEIKSKYPKPPVKKEPVKRRVKKLGRGKRRR